MRSFVKIKSSHNCEITLSTTDIGNSYHSGKIFRSQVCLLTLFAKIKFSRKFPDLQYSSALRTRFFSIEANNISPDQEQSDLGPYCLQYRLPS